MIKTESNFGILGQRAPDWDVNRWINLPPGWNDLELDDFENKIVYLFCFQHWCTHCHTEGFPLLNTVWRHYRNNPKIEFVAIQTVFEGFHVNTFDAAYDSMEKHDLSIPIGHDPGLDNLGSELMKNYRTGGTPWSILIDAEGIVRFNDTHLSAEEMIEQIDQLLASMK